MRNLVASRVRTLIVGGIVALGVVVVVLGGSLLDTIDVGMTRSIQDSLGGHVQLYNAASRDPLALYGGTMGESVLEPIADFAGLKAAALSVPGVKQVVPMGIDQAMVSIGNVFDVALEKLRADVRRRLEAGRARRGPEYEAHQAHVRRMATLLSEVRRPASGRRDLRRRPGRKAARPSRRPSTASGRTSSATRSRASSSSRTGSRRSRSTPVHLHPLRRHRRGGLHEGLHRRRGRGGQRHPARPARHPARQAVRRGVAQAQERAPPRQDQGRARPATAAGSPRTRSCSAG